jgi:hypothetical protein
MPVWPQILDCVSPTMLSKKELIEPKPDERRLIFKRRALKLAPYNDEVKKLRAEVVKLLNLASDPKTTN